MLTFKKRKIKKRKLILPMIFISIMLAGFLFLHLKNGLFQFDWQSPFSRPELIKPIPEDSLEEEMRQNLSPLGKELKSLDLSSEKKVIATFSGDLTVIFSREKDFHFQVASLQFILWRAKIEGKSPFFVDLRFDKPVVKI
jgi:hypothetical protein